MGANTGDRNPNWRGGRSVTSHGYVLIRVGPEHHLADCRGYAYEHRLVAETYLGRRLKPSEEIHHIDGDRANNDIHNLRVCARRHSHRVLHRRTSRRLRNPGERNPLVCCGCGCHSKLRRFDGSGRARRFVSGHNMLVKGAASGC